MNARKTETTAESMLIASTLLEASRARAVRDSQEMDSSA